MFHSDLISEGSHWQSILFLRSELKQELTRWRKACVQMLSVKTITASNCRLPLQDVTNTACALYCNYTTSLNDNEYDFEYQN
jgi:hypothetical protein